MAVAIYVCFSCFEKHAESVDDPKEAEEFAGYGSNFDRKCGNCGMAHAAIGLGTDDEFY